MDIVRAGDFRTHQTAILKKAKNGESVLLSSLADMFNITPVTEEDSLFYPYL